MSDKFIFRFVAIITIVVVLLVVLLNRHLIPGPAVAPAFTPFLPKLNAILNATCTVLLLTSLYFIRKGNVAVHKKLNIITFCLSAIFLISYVLFHYLMRNEILYGDSNFDGVLSPQEREAAGGLRTLYLTILTPHIILAAAVLPLILLSFYRGLQMQVEKHRKLVRWTFPIWLFVTITGVIVYLMVSPYYNF